MKTIFLTILLQYFSLMNYSPLSIYHYLINKWFPGWNYNYMCDFPTFLCNKGFNILSHEIKFIEVESFLSSYILSDQIKFTGVKQINVSTKGVPVSWQVCLFKRNVIVGFITAYLFGRHMSYAYSSETIQAARITIVNYKCTMCVCSFVDFTGLC